MGKRRTLKLCPLAIAVGALLAGCGGGHHQSHVVTGTRSGIARATLDVVSGATSVTVDSAALGGSLYRVSTPSGSGLVPFVRFNHGRLRVSLTGHGQPARLTIALSDAVVWNLEFSGGAKSLATDFRSGKLSGIELVAGNARAMLMLPHPSGTVAIVEDGGVSGLTVRVPGDVPTRLEVGGGAAHVGFGGVTHTGVAGGSVFSSPGWSSAHNRYELTAKGGVSSLLVLIEPA